jgi:hypothetical protein
VYRIAIWRGFLLVAVVVLAWQNLSAGLGGYYAIIAGGDVTAIDRALAWQPEHPRALSIKGSTLLESDPETAVALLTRAYRANVTSPTPLIALANQFGKEGHWEQSDNLIDLIAHLAPADPNVQMKIASHWALRERPDRMLQYWSIALTIDPTRQSILFPALLGVADNPQLRPLFVPYTQSPPTWWSGFFRHVCADPAKLKTARALFDLRRRYGDRPIQPEERAAYVAALLRAGMTPDAYLVWVGGLDDRARRRLGLLFDGGFELPLGKDSFGWQLSENSHFSATAVATPGATGLGLRLRFRAFEGAFNHLSQTLFLHPGSYRLTGRVRPDGLVSKGGLRWQVNCLRPEQKALGTGPSVMGSSEWDSFELSFAVPAGCLPQELRLVAAGQRAFERRFSGSLWFDDLKIERVMEPEASEQAGGGEVQPAQSGRVRSAYPTNDVPSRRRARKPPGLK